MQRLFNLFLIFGLTLLISNCSKDVPLRSLVYTETKCSDPWKTTEGNNETEVEAALMAFLEQDLKVANSSVKITFDADKAQDCEACDCSTGRIITVEVEKGFVPILEDNGFVLIP